MDLNTQQKKERVFNRIGRDEVNLVGLQESIKRDAGKKFQLIEVMWINVLVNIAV